MYFPPAFRFLVVASACEFVTVTLTVAQRGVRGAIVHACEFVTRPLLRRPVMPVVPFHVFLLSKSDAYVHDKRTWMYMTPSRALKNSILPRASPSFITLILLTLKLFQLRATARCLKTNAKGPRPYRKIYV